jgi:hypothetical protein
MIINWLFIHKKNIPVTVIQDLNPRPYTDNDHTSVLLFEMVVFDPGDGEILTHTLTWKPSALLSHIKCHTIDDRFPLSLWEVWYYSTLGVPMLALLGSPQKCTCNTFRYDSYGDHLQTRQSKSTVSQVNEWVVYKFDSLFGSLGHRVKKDPQDNSSDWQRTGWITTTDVKKGGDIEIKDYIVLQKKTGRLLFLHAHREASALNGELPEGSDQFRFLRAACLFKLKGSDTRSVGLILAKESVMRISIPLDLSSLFYRFFYSS